MDSTRLAAHRPASAATPDPIQLPSRAVDLSTAPWWATRERRELVAKPARPTSPMHELVARLADLRAWEWDHVPLLRRRVSAEVFYAVWLLAGPAHDQTFTLKCVAAHAHAGNRSVRGALSGMRADGWIERTAPDTDRRLRPYRATAQLVAVLERYERELDRAVRDPRGSLLPAPNAAAGSAESAATSAVASAAPVVDARRGLFVRELANLT
jgi:hypothetical protein